MFSGTYQVQLTKHDLESLGLQTKDGARYFTIVTIPQDPTQMTANLKAPVVINVKQRLARQCVLQDNQLNIREPIFTRLQQRVVQNPQISIKDQSVYQGMAVKLGNRPPEIES